MQPILYQLFAIIGFLVVTFGSIYLLYRWYDEWRFNRILKESKQTRLMTASQ